MTTDAILVTVASSLLSGLIGVLVSFTLFSRLEKRKLKMETARKLFGGKHDMSNANFQEAMNEIMIVFSDSDPVIVAMDELWTMLQTPIEVRPPGGPEDKLVRLMKALCTDLGIRYKSLPDAYFLRFFSVPSEGR